MGREHELREAAQDGNVAKLETLLSAKKSALMSSWRKGININCQDENGNTALHLAALNGRKDAVILLLQNDASANIPDLSGNYPLHLAAFNGHHEVANTLINQGPSRANVIEQNLAGDTALHIAAQYGHTHVVQILLECHADGNIRNKKDESPLDLAAMYGRLSTVRVLVLSDPTLVKCSCEKHSPLHLSARNGHSSVIEALLDFGMSVNVMCDRGTALHEAALFGKIDAVKMLLKRGIDVNARNLDDLTVLDLLVDLPSERSQEITALIYEQSNMMASMQTARSKSLSFVGNKDDQGQDPRRPSRNGEQIDEGREAYSQVGQFRSATLSERRPEKSPPYSLVQYPRISRLEESLDQASISPLPAGNQVNQDDIFNDEFLRQQRPQLAVSAERPPKPKRTTLETKTRSALMNTYEEYSVPANRDSVSEVGHSSTELNTNQNCQNRDARSGHSQFTEQQSYQNRDLRSDQSQFTEQQSYQNRDLRSDQSQFTEQQSYQNRDLRSDQSQFTEQQSYQNRDLRSDQSKLTEQQSYQNRDTSVYDIVPPLRPAAGSVTSQASRSSVPSFPPPTSEEALRAVEEFTGTTSQSRVPEYEGRSEEVAAASSAAASARQAIPQAGLERDTSALSGFERLHLNMSPPLSSSDTYDNVNITNKPTAREESVDLLSFADPASSQQTDTRRMSGVKQKRTRDPLKQMPSNASSGSRPTSTLNESYEWSKIDNIFSSLDDLIHAETPEQLEDTQEMPDSVGVWLSNLGLSLYEASFVANGYDDIRFIGGEMMDEDDLHEIGIQNKDHIRTILLSASNLPAQPRIGDNEFPIPETVKEWLSKICLSDYESRFNMNGYASMDRVRAIWEFELTTVIGIHLNGHRKRMVYSLGHRPEQAREQVSWSTRFAAAEAPKSAPSNDDPMDLANHLLKAAEDMVNGFENRRDSKSEGKKTPAQKIESPSSPGPPKSPDMLKYEPSFDWIHQPETLLYDSATYPTQYLGSHPVLVVRGTESTLDACKKMKATSQMVQKIPTIQLAISVRGIDFIDAQSHSVISSYDIRNISYVAQDPADLTVYAYITKDSKNGKHYCHVFRAMNLTLADEIVLTIGQAFELAYHQHRILIEGSKQRDKTSSDPHTHASQNRLNQDDRSDSKGKNHPPMPKPFSQRASVRKVQDTSHAQ